MVAEIELLESTKTKNIVNSNKEGEIIYR